MTRVKIRHYVVRRKKGFWQPTAKMRAQGFGAVPLGVDAPEAWAKAEEWNARWDKTRRGEAPPPIAADNLSPQKIEELTIYPIKSIGEAFKRYRRTDEWSRKAKGTRDEWWRVWTRIKPVFGDCDPRTVTLEDISELRKAVEEMVSLREAHRTIKVWRALWKVMAALQYCDREADPSMGVRNTAAKGRSATWDEGEAARLFKQAWRDGFHGLAAVMAVAWSTQLSPGDVRALRASQMALAANGAPFFTDRGKTGEPVGGILSDRALAALSAYIGQLKFDLLDEAFIFRNRSGRAYSKDTLGDDFRTVRQALFGEHETRTLADFRRSGANEAIAGAATAEALSHVMGNTLSASNALFKTYCPVNVASLTSVAEARRRGRSKLR